MEGALPMKSLALMKDLGLVMDALPMKGLALMKDPLPVMGPAPVVDAPSVTGGYQ
jgi:hypothetical protein